ncbi:hypothetical protein QYS48_27660 [Marivirga arenosa]|uniref:DUF4221 domain-containing protein n=1 Tax=Marivirga arenosa TaxID=3059076 RepID=A0AA51N6X4_9BACT|nr:hypothetical protein [Marivirga sp. ABR2-2]WMN07064.1 hypothetical protein QYS48_27660 [Marivirga sp. ABR2-2]
MNKIFIPPLTSVLLFFSIQQNYCQEIEILDTTAIELQSGVKETTSNTQHKKINGVNYLFRFNDYQSSNNPLQLEIINLEEQKIEKVIQFPLYGNNAFEEVVNFYVHNFDSIFFHNEAFPLTFYLTDTSKNLVKKWESTDMTLGAGWHSNASPFLIDNKLYFYSISTQSFYPDDLAFFNVNHLSYLKLENGKISEIKNLKYPNEILAAHQNNKWYPWSQNPYFHHYGSAIYVGFNMSKKLIKIENKQEKNIELDIGSRKLSKAVSMDDNDFVSNQLYVIESPQLGEIVYDPYRNKLIRLYKKTILLEANEDRSNAYYRSDFTLLFFEPDGELSGTIALPSNKFNPSIIIPTKRGLLINTDNPFNPNNNEDFLEFALISLSDIE